MHLWDLLWNTEYRSWNDTFKCLRTCAVLTGWVRFYGQKNKVEYIKLHFHISKLELVPRVKSKGFLSFKEQRGDWVTSVFLKRTSHSLTYLTFLVWTPSPQFCLRSTLLTFHKLQGSATHTYWLQSLWHGTTSYSWTERILQHISNLSNRQRNYIRCRSYLSL